MGIRFKRDACTGPDRFPPAPPVVEYPPMAETFGFILNHRIHVENGAETLEYFGLLEDGSPFLWRPAGAVTVAFTEEGYEHPDLKSQSVKKGRFRSLAGKPLDAHFFRTAEDLKQAAQKVPREALLESDMNTGHRFLMEKKVKGGIAFMGPGTKDGRGLVVFETEEYRPARVDPPLRICSLDIETGVASGRLYSVAVHLTGACPEKKAVWILADSAEMRADHTEYVTSEADMLTRLGRFLQDEKVHVLIGWNVVNFDLQFLWNKCLTLGVPFDWGVGGLTPDAWKSSKGRDFNIDIPGRLVLDGIPVMRAAGYRFSGWSLDHVSGEILGERKLITGDVDKIAEIEHQFAHDKMALARYNLKDTELVSRLFEAAGILPLFVERQRLLGTPIEKQQFPSEVMDFLYLPTLHRAGYGAPTANPMAPRIEVEDPAVRPPVAGQFGETCEIAVSEMLPEVLKAFAMDPLGRALAEQAPGEALTVPGTLVPFHRTKHLLPALLSNLEKEGTERAVDTIKAQVRQALETPSSRFYSPSLAGAMRTAARLVIQECISVLEAKGFLVLMAHSESLVVHSRDGKLANLEKDVLPEMQKHVAQTLDKQWKVKWTAPFRITARYHQVFIPGKALDGQAPGTRRLAALPHGGAPGAMLLEGMEGKGWDEPPLTKRFLREILSAFFSQQNPSDVVDRFRTELQDGKLDGELKITQRWRKDANPADKNAAPAVVAAHKMGADQTGDRVTWVMTTSGPEPVQKMKGKIDHAWYREQFLLPLAERLLTGTAYENATESLRKAQDQLSFF